MGESKISHAGGRTCRRCGQKFRQPQGRPPAGPILCPDCIPFRRRKGEREVDSGAEPERPDRRRLAEHPGAEWGPLPDGLIERASARALATKYVAWAKREK